MQVRNDSAASSAGRETGLFAGRAVRLRHESSLDRNNAEPSRNASMHPW